MRYRSQEPSSIESPLLDTVETAAYIRRDPDFVRRTLKYECPYVQHGDRGPLFFNRRDLDVWLLQHTKTPVAAGVHRKGARG